MERVNWERVRDILISILCVGILLWAGWIIMSQFLQVIVLLLLGMAVAFLLTPMVNFLEKYHVPRVLATLLVFIVVLAALGTLGYALVFSIIKQIQNLSTQVSTFVTTDLPNLATRAQKFLIDQGIPNSNINDALTNLGNQATASLKDLASNIVNFAFAITNVLLNILIVIVISFYLTLDGKRIRDGLFSVAPRRSVPHLLIFEDALNRVVGNYIRGQLTLATIIGLLAGVGCAFIGLKDYALIIGVLAFLFETIPMVGPALASIPAILISLLLPDPFPRTFWIIVYFVAIQAVESNILGPRIVGHAVGLHPVASILALIIGAQLFGPLGALLATPIVAALWVVIASFYRSIRGETPDEMLATRKRTPWVLRRNNRRQAASTNGHDTTSNHTPRMDHIDLLRPVPDELEEAPTIQKIGDEEE